MQNTKLPPRNVMYGAFERRDPEYDGLFVTAVKTTGIFCRPTCPARKPRRENVEFFPTSRDAVMAGYRPCLRCRPLESNGKTPGWISPLLAAVEEDLTRKWRDRDIRKLDLDPVRVRRWFKRHHGMTFHTYQRARRLGRALERIREGERVTTTAFEHGYESLSGFRDAFEKLFGSAPSSTSGPIMSASRIITPIGPMLACATEEELCLLEFTDRPMLETQLKRLRKYVGGNLVPGTNRIIDLTTVQLTEYFERKRREFDLPLRMDGSAFQRRVWTALLRIPYGGTSTYSRIAQEIGSCEARRAVGTANGDNRIAIVIPCHRVIRSDGTLSGYGGGRWRKNFLLQLERG